MPEILWVDALEPRLLMSATASPVFNSAVRLDRLHVHVDLLKFKTDCLSNAIRTLSDTAAIRRDDPGQATTVVPLIAKMKTDLAQMRLALLQDRLAEATAVLADESVILVDLKKALADKGNATAETADHEKLHADRIAMQNDMIAGLNTRIATRQSAYDTIFNDGQAIIDAVQSDPNASTKLQADVSKWVAHRTAHMNTIAADLQKLVADRTQLAADLQASAG